MSTKIKINSQIFQDSNNIYYPKDESEVSDLIRELYKQDSPTEIIGNNSKSFIGNKTQSANTTSLSKISGIIDYRPEELYIKVKACTPINEIEQVLSENSQELAFEPIDFGYIKEGKSNKGTIAGYLSCNYAGSRRFKVGSVRDHVLGFKGVNGKGDIIKSGGTVVKNVTGYDLSKLIAGSFGTLVALTEITLKVLPKKDSSKTVIIYPSNFEQIYDFFNKLSSSSSEISELFNSSSFFKLLIFSSIEILSPSTLNAINETFDLRSLNLKTEFFLVTKSLSFDCSGTKTAPEISLLELDSLLKKS